ncbi:MAG: phosphoadenosine phosphosulfate reductase [Limisphaerales bacterium]|jgi:phosphoadenosine phosphosulfate reductase
MKSITDWNIADWNRRFDSMTAEERVRVALDQLPETHVLSSSFGAQAAVSLHLLSTAKPNIPVLLIDTGYLFAETYAFVETLKQRLDLNVEVYSAKMTAAMQEAVFGQRWLQGIDGLDAYNRDNKVEPMKRGLAELNAGTWFTGIRRVQAETRSQTPFIQKADGRYKVAPIADWTDKDVFNYLKKHDLPYHPLWEQGYISIGDVHTTKSLLEVEDESQTRFFGLKRECGIHA